MTVTALENYSSWSLIQNLKLFSYSANTLERYYNNVLHLLLDLAVIYLKATL